MTIRLDGERWFAGHAACVLVGNVGRVLGGIEVFGGIHLTGLRSGAMERPHPRAGVHYPRSAGELRSWFPTDELHAPGETRDLH